MTGFSSPGPSSARRSGITSGAGDKNDKKREEAEFLFFENRNIDKERYITDPVYNRTIKAFMIEFIDGFQCALKYQKSKEQ